MRKQNKEIEKFKDLIERYGAMQLLGSDGSCACGELYLFGIMVKTHCFKTTLTGRFGGCGCIYGGVHIWKDEGIDISKKELKAIGKLFADYIRGVYQYGCEVVIEEGKKRWKKK